MPVKNAEQYLSDCLQSIIDQTYRNWELIAINDHSEDNSLDILITFANSDDRIKVKENGGTGIIDALKTAYAEASGEFISRMDADDIMPPQKLEWMRNTFIESLNHLVTGKVEYFSDTNLGEGYQRYGDWLNQLADESQQFEQIYKECVIPSAAWMMHRSLFDLHRGFDILDYPEDYDLCFQWYRAGIPVLRLNKILHKWRDHPDRTSRNSEHYLDNRFLELKIRHFVEHESIEGALYVWGAGRKGKIIAELLNEHGKSFKWITNNQEKIGKTIKDTVLDAIPDEFPVNSSLIIAVAGPEDQAEIKRLIDQQTHLNHYWFC